MDLMIVDVDVSRALAPERQLGDLYRFGELALVAAENILRSLGLTEIEKTPHKIPVMSRRRFQLTQFERTFTPFDISDENLLYGKPSDNDDVDFDERLNADLFENGNAYNLKLAVRVPNPSKDYLTSVALAVHEAFQKYIESQSCREPVRIRCTVLDFPGKKDEIYKGLSGYVNGGMLHLSAA